MSKSRTKASTLPYLVRSHYLVLGVIGATGYITDLYRGRISLVRGHCNSCLGKPLVHEGTTAIPMTVEGHQGKSRNSKGASRQTMHLLSINKLHLLKG